MFRGPNVHSEWLAERAQKEGYCLNRLTSLQTNASSGMVVNIFNPNANLATLIKTLSEGKLFRMFPTVLSVNTRYPDTARAKQVKNAIAILQCVTIANRFSDGCLSDPNIRKLL